jgi:hypothetical protein
VWSERTKYRNFVVKCALFANLAFSTPCLVVWMNVAEDEPAIQQNKFRKLLHFDSYWSDKDFSTLISIPQNTRPSTTYITLFISELDEQPTEWIRRENRLRHTFKSIQFLLKGFSCFFPIKVALQLMLVNRRK